MLSQVPHDLEHRWKFKWAQAPWGSARQGMAQTKSLLKSLFPITSEQIKELRREAARLPGNVSDEHLLDPDRMASLRSGVDHQKAQNTDSRLLIRSLK